MDFSIYQTVELYCPNCGHKVIGYLSEDGALRIICDRCGVKIYSKRKNSKKTTIEVIAPYVETGVY